MRQIGNQAGCAIFLAALALVLGTQGAPAETLTGTPRIVDGDTLELGREIVRLYGIDAPEADQRCKKSAYITCREESTDTLGAGHDGQGCFILS